MWFSGNVEVIRAPSAISSNVLASLSVLSLNVLLPNSIDGWWVKKMYCPGADLEEISSWPYRQRLLVREIEEANADVVALQEVCAESFQTDFVEPLARLGYDSCLLYKKGRFRPATLWRSEKCALLAEAHRDRALITLFELVDSRQHEVALVNAHLQAGAFNGGRRLRQTQEALDHCKKLFSKRTSKARTIFCGDMNADGENSAAIRLLLHGEVPAGYLEDGISVSSKHRTSPLGTFIDAATTPVATPDRPNPPATMIVRELFSILSREQSDGSLTLSPVAIEALSRAFRSFCSDEQDFMSLAATESWLKAINGRLGRGFEFRAALARLCEKYSVVPTTKNTTLLATWQEIPAEAQFELSDFLHVYTKELHNIWGLAHDLSVFGEWPLPPQADDTGLTKRDQPELFTARFDRIFASRSGCSVLAVRDSVRSEPCPNAYHASDHLPVAALIQLHDDDNE